MSPKKEKGGCGCASIPLSVILILLGGGYWGVTNLGKLNLSRFLPAEISQLLPNNQQAAPAIEQPPSSPKPALSPKVLPTHSSTPQPQVTSSPVIASATPSPSVAATQKTSSIQTVWETKAIRGIYLSRYQVTNNADEQTIRKRVRYYHQQGFNTIIHGVWGNGCTMYHSQVMQQAFGYDSCPNQFQDQWLNWLIDEAHKQGMQVHAYFEKGIKLDQNSPIFDLAVAKKWIVPGVDKTYAGIDHYVLDVESPEVASFFRKISVEFVQKYPQIDAVQWDDYLGYYAGLPGKVDRTAGLTKFVRQMRNDMKKANSKVSFDICHHNPYWGKRYFAADWQNWQVDRVFIQTYNDANFDQELSYAENYAGVALSEKQLYRLKALVNNARIKGILVFPFSGKPEQAAALVNQAIVKNK
ncbi:MAG TPA: family 10 glycosylhydrolase [Microcoleaceae cyanobacterium]